ncbi:MAG TPA: response regulator [Candidatus Angelobacter sp.]|nr:response regulator [Candidatus Angelobacter sp.]
MANILIIEDDAHVRMAIQHCLKKSGHTVRVATDGREGLTYIQKNPVDLVVTDLFMEGQEGLETITALRKKHPKLPIIAMSGGNPASQTMLTVARELGAQQVLSKPFWSKGLLEAVEKALGPAHREKAER